jgi:predicted MFS family arabinose efflux permease
MSNPRSLIAMGAFSMAGNTPLVVQPMVVGAMVDLLGLTERQAGIVASVELVGLTLGILAMIPVMSSAPRAALALFAVAAITGANLLTCFVSSFTWLLPTRFLSGIGAAAAFCLYLNMASSDDQPEHVFAIVNAISITYSGILTLLAPYLLHAGGLPGLLLTLCLMTLLALLTIPWVIRYGPQSYRQQSHGPQRSRPTPLTGFTSLPSRVMLLLAMMLLLYAGHGAIWAYQERIGVAAGLDEHAVGKWLGLSMLIWGVGGSLLARLMSMSIGRMWPQVISLGASCVAVLLLVYGSTPAAFAISCGLIAFSWFYGLPYQMGLLAARDPKGRAALAGVMMSTGGMALGPAIAALLLVGRAHWPIGVFAGICYLLALAIAIPSARNPAPLAAIPTT